MDVRGRKSINKALFMWAVAAILLLIMATPALSTIFAAPGSVNTRAIVNRAVKAKKIANGAVNSAKIRDGSITNADIAAGAGIAASKINRTGLNADLLDGKDSGDFVGKTGNHTMTGDLTAQNLKYGSAKTGYFAINGTAFQPDGGVTLDKWANIVTTTGGGNWIMAQVNLPHGATVTGLSAVVDDADASSDITVSLHRGTASGVSPSMASATSSGTGVQSISDNTIADPVIDNSLYGYDIWVYMHPVGHKLSLAKITYTYTSAGD